MSNEPLYSVGTYDWDAEEYTPQVGLSVPSFNITLSQLRQAVRELKKMGYMAHRIRDKNGDHDDNDPNVLIERTDGLSESQIIENWKR